MNEQYAATFLQKIYRGYKTRYNTVLKLINDNSNRWNKLIDLYNIFGETLNANDMKFMKGKLYEIFFSEKSKLFKHVDRTGYDILCLGISNICLRCSSYHIFYEIPMSRSIYNCKIIFTCLKFP